MKLLLVGLMMLTLAACEGAHRESATPDAAVPSDAEPPTCNGVVCDEAPPATCADADTLRTYAAECVDATCSYPQTEIECGAAGCCTDHCCEIAPSNASDFGTLAPTGLTVAPPNGTFNTDTECMQSSALGTCTVVARQGLPEACGCRADTITIGTLDVTGKRALVLYAAKKVVVQTLLEVAGASGIDGPGATLRYATDQSTVDGGAGGSFATLGGGASGDSAAAVYGEPTLIPLVGGMRGQAAGGAGGGGGGALQITAGEQIDILGVVNAGGGGGASGLGSYSYRGAGGGGSGGGILLEAPVVNVSGTVVANGGGGGGGGGNSGGGGGGGHGGKNGFPPDPTYAAYGGSGNDGAGCPLYGYVDGGDGGAGGYGAGTGGYGGSGETDSRCIGETSFVGGGGGGGGVGRIRINTSSGCQCGGNIAPQATFGMLGKR